MTKEKLIEIIQCAIFDYDNHDYDYSYVSNRAADLILAQLPPQREVEVNQWISVKDRLPGNYERVLVGYDKSVSLAYYVSNNKLFYDSLSVNYKSDVITHWQPLPSPPTN